MKPNKCWLYLLALIFCWSLSGCVSEQDKETLTQFSTFYALKVGDYYGFKTVDELPKYGDFGLGTFNALNGEMILLDGICYQALADGTVVLANPQETIPFACVSFFKANFSVTVKNIPDLETLERELSLIIAPKSFNCPYLVKLTGTFENVQVRSLPIQSEPYKTLAEVIVKEQEKFAYEQQAGTLIGFYLPNYLNGVNTTGWQFHFISDDHTKGGRVLEVSLSKALAKFDRTDSFRLILPPTQNFDKLDLGSNLTNSVEN